jgi:hypothetical protein
MKQHQPDGEAGEGFRLQSVVENSNTLFLWGFSTRSEDLTNPEFYGLYDIGLDT